MSVVTSVVEVDIEVDVDGGSGAPGVSMCPPNTEIASVRLRVVAAVIRRKVFTWFLLREMKKFFINLDERDSSCKSARDFVRFGRNFFPCVQM